MENVMIIGIVLVIVGIAVLFIWKEKKKGSRCIGCPAAGCCKQNGCGKAKKNVLEKKEDRAFAIRNSENEF